MATPARTALRPSGDVVRMPHRQLSGVRGRLARPDLRRLIRPAALAAGLLAASALAYLGARETSVFAIQSVEVAGAPPAVARDVHEALRPFLGSSLVSLDHGELRARVLALPAVRRFSYDRAFPHTLRLVVVPERPLAVLRQGARSWLLSRRGRVVARLGTGQRRGLPRIWAGRDTRVVLGERVGGEAAAAASALAALPRGRFARKILVAEMRKAALSFRLRGGLELRLGEAKNVPLKVAIARRILSLHAVDTTPGSYLDLTVPTRPVAGPDRKAGGRAES